MRKYLFGTGIFGSIVGGVALLRAARGGVPFTWRVLLAWLSWGISLTLAIGAIIDIRRAERGEALGPDSPFAGQEDALRERKAQRRRRKAGL